MIIEKIIKDLPEDIRPEECYIFRDGSVEMREAEKRGFTRIGLISDEKQRFGINPGDKAKPLKKMVEEEISCFIFIKN